MRAVRSTNTRPEMIVRRAAHALGYRYRLHVSSLPGKPDLAFPARRKVVFVNGCFWHGHDCKRGSRKPSTNASYWSAKIDRNRARDQYQLKQLSSLGWSSLVIWECEISDLDALKRRLIAFLERGDVLPPALL